MGLHTPLPVVLGPFAGGIVAGVLHVLLGPDHICTIVTLSAFQGTKAFWFGVRWAGGHMLGMCVIGLVFAVINVSSGGAAWEVYEHYVDYFIGAMLVFFGVHFLMHTEHYFDSEWAPKQATCACHAELMPDEGSGGHGHGHGGGHGHGHGHHGHQGAREADPLLPASSKLSEGGGGTGDGGHGGVMSGGLRSYGSSLAGFVQGIACPAGIVGMSFLKHYSLPEMAVFITVFFVITTFCMGCLAMAYGVLTSRYISSALLARYVYYFSCTLSIGLGMAFIILNGMGVLDEVMGHDHSEHGHGHSHAHAGGHDHGHAHEHVHQEESGVVDVHSLVLFAMPR